MKVNKLVNKIVKEIEIWKVAYPNNKELVNKLANKIFFECNIDFKKKINKIKEKFEFDYGENSSWIDNILNENTNKK